jgi:glycosyltransferase involved in cell wall biosynthesis
MTWRLIRSFKPDVVHAHWLVPQGFVVAILTLMKAVECVPFLVTSHGADLFSLQSSAFIMLKRFAARRADLITVVSRAMYDQAVRLGVKIEKLRICPMGVDLNSRFCHDDADVRSADEILFVGRLVEKKGLKYLIGAIPDILLEFPSAHLTIAGFGPEESLLKAQVSVLKIEDNVTFMAAVPQSVLPSLYRRAAVFVAPFVEAASGDQEGLGLVVIEALGCGCPVVVSDVPAIRDVTQIVNNVRIVPPKNSGLLASVICQTLVEHSDRENRFEDIEANSLLKKKFDWDSVAERYSAELTRLIAIQLKARSGGGR